MYLAKLGILVVGFESVVKLVSDTPRRCMAATLAGMIETCRRGHKRSIALVLKTKGFMVTIDLNVGWRE